MIKFAQGNAGEKLQNAMDNLNCIKVSKIREKFGKEKGKILLNIFGLRRKRGGLFVL